MIKPIDFYNTIKETLDALAKVRGISNLERYYELTDYSKGSFLNKFSGKARIFAQMAFHAQNATMISGIVKFEQNLEFLKEVLCGFDPDGFLKKYPGLAYAEILVNNLRYDDNTGKGLKWNSDTSKNKDAIITRYAKSLIYCAEYINEFSNEQEFLQDLKNHYPNNYDYRKLIEYFRSKIKVGFSIALTCDFLKEYDETFKDLPKPDIHIKDTLRAYYGKGPGFYSGEKKEYECIEKMQELTKEINSSLGQDEQITVYQLDRMIWLICSGNFYLDKSANDKSAFLNKIIKSK